MSMNTQTRLARIIVSPLVLWIVGVAIGSYYMVSFDKKTLQQSTETGLVGTVKKYYNAAKLAYIQKGIDLAGGTYLVLGVEIEKALENRLGIESKGLDSLFKNKELKVLPVTKEIKGLSIEMTFPDDGAAKACLNLLKETKMQVLRPSQSDTVVTVVLAPEIEQAVRTGAVDQAVNVLTARLGGYGVEGIIVQQHGERQVVVQLPGIDDSERVKSVITKTALLEMKIVEKVAGSKESLMDEFDGDLPSDKMIIPGKRDVTDADSEEGGRWYLVSAFPDLTGDHIIDARVDRDEYNKTVVSFKLDSVGAREFADLTGKNVGRQLGIIIDNVMMNAPSVRDEIRGGSGIITGLASHKEAIDLSIVLKSGALSAPLKIEQENRVGASLGQDSINKGMLSCLVALLLLFIFSIFYYKIPGLLAVLALICNIFVTMLFLSYFRATLTLPGIAGIVLTIGMAIDASILIYEKVKEELLLGVPLRKSVYDGFSGAMAVILDSNITTFLTGMVLYQFGGPAIKGFAVTLMAGIIATLLTGIYFLRAMFSFIFEATNVKTLKF